MGGLNRRLVTLAIVLLASIGFLAYTVVSGGRPTRTPVAAERGRAGPVKARADRVAELVAAPSDVTFARYEVIAKREIFSPPWAPKPESSTSRPAVPPLATPPTTGGSDTSGPPPPRVDVSGWTYVGYIVMGGVRYGLLQNEANDTMTEVPVGGEFLGAKVEEATSEEMRLSAGESRITLTVPRDFAVTPLTKGATAAPGRPRPTPRPAEPPPPPAEEGPPE